MPFDEQQTNRYIFKRIPFWRIGQRLRAREYVANLHDLPHRPMLLAEIPALASRKIKITEINELYDFMVSQWFKREERWISAELLRRVSRLLAIDILMNLEARQSASISTAELDNLLAREEVRVGSSERWLLTTRSLLNRDSLGRVKFAHRSIMEFFFVDALTSGDRRALSVQWTDQIKEFPTSWLAVSSPDNQISVLASFKDEVVSSSGLVPFAPLKPEILPQLLPIDLRLIHPIPGLLAKYRVPVVLEQALVRKASVRVEVDGKPLLRLHRIYDLGYGVSFTIPTHFIYDSSEYPNGCTVVWTQPAEFEALRVALPHMRVLARLLVCIDATLGLTSTFSRRELYWIGDGRLNLKYAIRLRSASHPVVSIQVDGELLASIPFPSAKSSSECLVDIYQIYNNFSTGAVFIPVEYGRSDLRHEEEYDSMVWAKIYMVTLLRVHMAEVEQRVRFSKLV